MIRVKKSKPAPTVLTEKETKKEIANNKALYDANPDIYNSGEKKMEIKPSTYGHKSVKRQLIKDQNGKCCFCESKFEGVTSHGDIEHFRPKGGYYTGIDKDYRRPGYYWKAYDWGNLFFSCEMCNRSFKKSYFPLADESKRAKNHNDDLRKERPLLLHPSRNNPEKYIGFRENTCFPINNSSKGQKSIEIYGLNRRKLLEIRQDHLEHVERDFSWSKIEWKNLDEQSKKKVMSTFHKTEKQLIDLIKDAKQFIKHAAKDGAPYSNMVRQKIKALEKEWSSHRE